MEDKELGKHFEEGLEVIWWHDGRRVGILLLRQHVMWE